MGNVKNALSQGLFLSSYPIRIKTATLLWFFLLPFYSVLTAATVITVPGDYATIQAAIDAAVDGDEIIVSPGTYYENIYFGGKNIILRSTEPTSPTVVASTIIDGNQAGSVVTFAGTELTTCVLSGFTITNGLALKGGGIRGNGSLATIQYNNITTNSASYSSYGNSDSTTRANPLKSTFQQVKVPILKTTTDKGRGLDSGGIKSKWFSWPPPPPTSPARPPPCYGGGLYDCDGIIQNNSISGNSGYGYGSGLYGCDGTVQNNTVSYNKAGLGDCDGTIQNNTISYNNGRGLYYCEGIIRNNTISYNNEGGLRYCQGIIENNIISRNSTRWSGGGLYECDATIQNNTISGNSAEYGGGLSNCRGLIINCIVWTNTATTCSQLFNCNTPVHSCIEGWPGGGRCNISTDPKFIDPANGNYHLRSDSPCIDAGNTYYLFREYLADIDGECRVAGTAVDMGSDEFGSSMDSDSDLLADSNEVTYGSDPNNPDTDGDGLKDGVEVLRGTNPALYDTPSGISIPADYATIQQAMFLSFPCEVITVSLGTYYENLHFLGKDLILRSINPLDDNIVNTTIIDGDGLFSVITFKGTESERCVVRGLAIRNGAALTGGGICGNGTLATIERNKILGNSVRWEGSGLYQCHGTVQNNVIFNNSAYNGGGLYQCNGTIQNNIISQNSAIGNGGGLACCGGTIQNNIIYSNSAESGGGLYYCNGTIENNTISDNWAGWGGGLYLCHGTIQNNIMSGNSAYSMGGAVDSGYGIIQNNTIYGNSAAKFGGAFRFYNGTIQNNNIWGNSANLTGGGLAACHGTIQNNTIWGNSAGDYGGGLNYCPGTIRNCIVWQNSAPTGAQLYNCDTPSYSCIQDWTGSGAGNISSAPQLIDPTNGDFHLLPGSPCIDAGDPDPQYNDACRPPGKGTERNDMGAYGGPNNCMEVGPVPTPTPTPMPSPTPTPMPTLTPTPTVTPTPTPTGTPEISQLEINDGQLLSIAGDYEFVFFDSFTNRRYHKSEEAALSSPTLQLSGTFSQDTKGKVTFTGTITEDGISTSIATRGKLRVKKRANEIIGKLKRVAIGFNKASHIMLRLLISNNDLNLTIKYKNKGEPEVMASSSQPLVCPDRGAQIIIEEITEEKPGKRYIGSGTLYLPCGLKVPVSIKEKIKTKKDGSLIRRYKIKASDRSARLKLKTYMASAEADTIELLKARGRISYIKRLRPGSVVIYY